MIDALKDAAVTAYMFDHAIVFFGNTFCDIIEEAGDIFSSIVALQIALLHSQDLLCRVRAITILCDDSLYSSPSPEKKPMVLDSGITRSDGGRHCVSTVRIAGDIDLNNLPSKFASLNEKPRTISVSMPLSPSSTRRISRATKIPHRLPRCRPVTPT